uniref:Uncharacterized protein n=1 Tax=Oryza rufipogon TaxID=4529 RepID=A0A0E0NBA2_ORYRU
MPLSGERDMVTLCKYSAGGGGRRVMVSAAAAARPATCSACLLVTMTLLPRRPRRSVGMIASITRRLRASTPSNTARNLTPRSLRSRSASVSPLSPNTLVVVALAAPPVPANMERRSSAVSPAAMRLKQWKSSSMISEKRRRTSRSLQTCCTSVVFPRPWRPTIERTASSAPAGSPPPSPSLSCSKKSKTRRLSTFRPNIWLSA